MALSSVISLAKNITDLATSVQNRGDTFYRASIAHDDFKRNLNDLKREQKSLQERADKYGLSRDAKVIAALDRANWLLDNEQKRLEGFQSWWYFGCLFGLCGITFPPELAQSIKDLNKTLQSDLLEEELEKRVTEGLASHKGFRFREDHRYVRLPTIEREIRDALENKCLDDQSNIRVVLLEGAAGTGKSSMARYLALEYHAQISKTSRLPVETHCKPEASTSTSGVRDSHSVFDQVLFLECGEQIEPIAKYAELIKCLGWKTSLERKDGTQSEYLRGILKVCLQNRRVLLILDDVWDEDFLEDMATCMGGHGSKVLVTSQRSRLCESFTDPRLQSQSISIDRITTDSTDFALLILQVHAGFNLKDRVPEQITDCMLTLIDKVSPNPHALASLAATIDKLRRDKRGEWQNVIREHENLRSNDPAKDSRLQGIHYFSSIGVKFGRLSPVETEIMVLLAMFDGPSVPEEVIQLCHIGICTHLDLESERSSVAFSRARKQLEDLQCIKITEADDQLFWSIHFLDREFLMKTREAEMQSFFEKFKHLPRRQQGSDAEPQEHLVKLLGTLYLSSRWALPNAIRVLRGNKSNIRIRNAFQGVFRLMMTQIWEDDWSRKERSSADQIFLSYMCDRTFHEEAMKILLHSSASKQTVDAVLEIVAVSNIILSEDLIMNLLGTLGRLEYEVGENQNVLILNMEQCDFLDSLAWRGGDLDGHSVRWSLCRRHIVSGLIKAFKSRSNERKLRCHAIEAIGGLGHGYTSIEVEDRVAFLVEFPMLLSELAIVLEDHTCPDVQNSAAWSLYELSDAANDYGGVRLSITEVTGQQLIRVLGPNNNMRLQECAVWALRNLTYGSRELTMRILGFPHALDKILAVVGSPNSHEEFAEVRRGGCWVLWDILWSVIHPLSLGSQPDAKSELIYKSRMCLIQQLGSGFQLSGDAKQAVLRALTWIDPTKAKELQLESTEAFKGRGAQGLQLVSAEAFKGRGWSLVVFGHHQDGLKDLEEADRLYEGKDFQICWLLTLVNAKLEKWDIAMKDADRAMELANASGKDWDISLALQERGILKRMMGDLEGALKDLDDALKSDLNYYESLKHKAYVKFLLHDEDGACKDAKQAILYKPSWYDKPLVENSYLGASIVEFLDFRL